MKLQRMEIEGIIEMPDFAAIVSQTAKLIVRKMIPKSEVKTWFEPLDFKVSPKNKSNMTVEGLAAKFTG